MDIYSLDAGAAGRTRPTNKGKLTGAKPRKTTQNHRSNRNTSGRSERDFRSPGGPVGARLVSHDRDVAFQMAEVAISRQIFQEILRMIAELRPPPDPAPA